MEYVLLTVALGGVGLVGYSFCACYQSYRKQRKIQAKVKEALEPLMSSDTDQLIQGLSNLAETLTPFLEGRRDTPCDNPTFNAIFTLFKSLQPAEVAESCEVSKDRKDPEEPK